MKKIIKALLICLTVTVLSVGCEATKDVEAVVTEKVKKVVTPEVQNFEEMVKHLESEGVTVTERTVQVYEMVGAKMGESILLNGVSFEIYEFKDDDSVKKGVEYMKNFDADGLVNGKFLLVTFGDDPEVTKIFEDMNK